MASASHGARPPTKRRKVAESCKVCRAKKTRCDGLRPKCGPCLSRGAACEYNDTTIPISENALSDLETRLRRLEQQASSTSGESPAVPAAYTTPQYEPREARLDQNTHRPRLHSDTSFADHFTTQFIQDITRITDVQSAEPASQGSVERYQPSFPVETDTSAMVVPSRSIADDLVECYERFVYPLFPILHMPTFREDYQYLWGRQSEEHFRSLAAEATFHATLNIVFALGCINSSQIEPPLKLGRSKSYYHRARVLLPLDSLDTPSLGIVQYLLLSSTYLTFTAYTNRCKNTLAVAIQVAQTLGLHRDIGSSSNSQLEREMNRRTWHHCLTLERYANVSVISRISMAMC